MKSSISFLVTLLWVCECLLLAIQMGMTIRLHIILSTSRKVMNAPSDHALNTTINKELAGNGMTTLSVSNQTVS